MQIAIQYFVTIVTNAVTIIFNITYYIRQHLGSSRMIISQTESYYIEQITISLKYDIVHTISIDIGWHG